MIVTRLSATALNTAMSCLARFKAEYVDGGRGFQGTAATFGTAVHAALELYVNGAYLDTKFTREWTTLRDIWRMQHAIHYSGLDADPDELKLGEKLLKVWFDRADLEEEGRTVISTERKEHFNITVDGVEVHFTYIWDRCDRRADGSVVVVDYKTSAWNTSPDELRSKVQPRVYALAAQIKYPDATGIWVEFDMLKHENQPTGAYFRREDNEATWVALKKEIRKILVAPDNPRPTLNPECLFCPIKATCPEVKKNALAGGITGLNREDLINARAELEYQNKALTATMKELDTILLAAAKQEDALALSSETNQLIVTVRRTREVDADRVQMVLGPNLWQKYGESKITISVIDSLLKGKELTDQQKADLRSLISFNNGNPGLKAKPISGFAGL